MKKLSTKHTVTEVQSTSLLVSYWRYKEATKPAGIRLIDDLPDEILVDELLSSEQREIFENSPLLERGIDALALRTRFIDDWLLCRLPAVVFHDADDDTFAAVPCDWHSSQSRHHATKTVVNLGAGMDARPYRLKELARRSRYIEVDSNRSLLELKHSILQRMLKPHCHVIRSEADLSDSKMTRRVLRDAGLVVDDKSNVQDEDRSDARLESIDFVAEGLFAYLDPSCHKSLLQLCHDISGDHSRMVLTVLDPTGVRNFQADNAGSSSSSSSFQIPWKQLVPINVLVDQAKECGWEHVKVWQLSSMFEMYDRTPVSDLRGYAVLTLAKKNNGN
jgi:O-methyltransferase involved in polyketide biosynthesis